MRTTADYMIDWVDRIVDVALRNMREGADKHYVELMAEQYKYYLRKELQKEEHRHGLFGDASHAQSNAAKNGG